MKTPAPVIPSLRGPTIAATLLNFIAVCSGLLLAGAVESYADAPSADAERLRSLARLPQMSFDLALSASVKGEFSLNKETLDAEPNQPPAERMAELRAKLKQDRSDAPSDYKAVSIAIRRYERKLLRSKSSRALLNQECREVTRMAVVVGRDGSPMGSYGSTMITIRFATQSS
jgi:hypothetical protein